MRTGVDKEVFLTLVCQGQVAASATKLWLLELKIILQISV